VALNNPQKVLNAETKAFFKAHITNLIFFSNLDSKLLPILMNAVIKICEIGNGYIDTWPELMNV